MEAKQQNHRKIYETELAPIIIAVHTPPLQPHTNALPHLLCHSSPKQGVNIFQQPLLQTPRVGGKRPAGPFHNLTDAQAF